MLLVIDIDATITNAEERIKRAGPEPDRTNRDLYIKWLDNIQNEESLLLDEPVPGMRDILSSLWLTTNTNFRIIYLTSREEKWRHITEKWLAMHFFPSFDLFMRPNDCWDESSKFKEDIIKKLRLESETVVLIDDDEKGTIEEMAKRNNYTFLKSRSGGQK